MLRKLLLKMLNGVPREFHDARMKKSASRNVDLEKMLFSCEADYVKVIAEHGNEIKLLKNEVASLKKEVKTLKNSKDDAIAIMGKSVLKQ